MEKFKLPFKQIISSVETKFWLKYYIISLFFSIGLIGVCANLILGQLAHRKVGQYKYN